MDYPALYTDANDASNSRQATFLRLIRAEYFLLFFASILSLDLAHTRVYFVVYAGVFLLSMIVLICRSLMKPEQGWYQARALAESVKTLAWRFAMRAHPFDDERVQDARADFRRQMAKILISNDKIGHSFAGKGAADPQTTKEMMRVRDLPLEDRKSLYLKERIDDQRRWYRAKARANRRAAWVWLCLAIAAYLVGFGFIVARIVDPDFLGWPTEPLIVVASALIGWTQIKKFNELASAYTLTAHEIGLTAELINDTTTEGDFSTAVNEAELAFSREHTQWVARQNS
ncbi:DUF4231 domain-containing protein [Mesorhizobium sp. M00.F.Ca.ET.217.01.1.1]|uniref:DUF4231 domain-containing protein n=1 Tax=Mesorhizobium sp. M00.F.Ca.ET.217.01.1.1 TaxID=2500529 RepID=UPI000FDB8953|nr:DUF4231 domain-containing protein [Mesorhizobium sp. M00.F.Ca.ET.217.01.1.1]TGQ13618.1 DUF4231 domain-containing protein [Mesorhizobium sp. M00.F.Ca.ET.217.01.1.1]TGV85486.1 DUF4231 domain-containing protein [Mesorhizobium sp. M00.F.Ca.ET.158.01.1.1]